MTTKANPNSKHAELGSDRGYRRLSPTSIEEFGIFGCDECDRVLSVNAVTLSRLPRNKYPAGAIQFDQTPDEADIAESRGGTAVCYECKQRIDDEDAAQDAIDAAVEETDEPLPTYERDAHFAAAAEVVEKGTIYERCAALAEELGVPFDQETEHGRRVFVVGTRRLAPGHAFDELEAMKLEQEPRGDRTFKIDRPIPAAKAVRLDWDKPAPPANEGDHHAISRPTPDRRSAVEGLALTLTLEERALVLEIYDAGVSAWENLRELGTPDEELELPFLAVPEDADGAAVAELVGCGIFDLRDAASPDDVENVRVSTLGLKVVEKMLPVARPGTFVRNPKGTFRRHVSVYDVSIPDLWHVASGLRSAGMDVAADLVLETWHLSHDLLTALRDVEEVESEEPFQGKISGEPTAGELEAIEAKRAAGDDADPATYEPPLPAPNAADARALEELGVPFESSHVRDLTLDNVVRFTGRRISDLLTDHTGDSERAIMKATRIVWAAREAARSDSRCRQDVQALMDGHAEA